MFKTCEHIIISFRARDGKQEQMYKNERTRERERQKGTKWEIQN